MKLNKAFLLILVTAFPLGTLHAAGNSETSEKPMAAETHAATGEMETAVFAGGCFWGVEAVFEALEGVENVMSGYSGGPAHTANYPMVTTGQTGHAEAVHVEFDPSVISYHSLLEVFFLVAHDPTQYNYQGPDVGPQYRSAVFYNNDGQKELTESFIMKLEKDGVYGKDIVTEVTELEAFYPAEEYHQDFMALNPNHPYIVYWDVPKIKHLEKMFPQYLKDE